MSPSPKVVSCPGTSPGCHSKGKMVRVMRFQSLFSVTGITGSMLRMFCVSSSGP